MSYRPLPPITESADELRARLKATRHPGLRQRLQLLLLLKDEACCSRQEAAERLLCHRNTIQRWLRLYQAGGLERLLEQKPRGRPPGQQTLPRAVFKALQDRLATEDGFGSYVEVQRWLEQEYDLEIPYKTVHHIVRYGLQAKLKRARPRHPQKN